MIIWDLDETFWNGTLSEEGCSVIERNISLIKELTNRGIVNSICSKNDFQTAKKQLVKLGVWDYFVFPHIAWSPKGAAIKNIILNAQLRDSNVLFIDDNNMNLAEAKHFNNKLNVQLPEFIDSILTHESFIGKDDFEHSRLTQYKVIENKLTHKSDLALDNLEFLKQSNIQIKFEFDAVNYIDRLFELESRSNQLNFTKLRSTYDDLKADIENNDSAAIFVADKYGDYGLVGFYCFYGKQLKHFVFSCRILNMYIENYLYKKLSSPIIEVRLPVSKELSDCLVDLNFISEVKQFNSEKQKVKKTGVLIVGGCDLETIGHYFSKSNLVNTEFNYINQECLSVHKEHSSLLRYSDECLDKNRDEIANILSKVPFISIADMETYKIFNESWDVLIYSPLNDYSRGLYRSKSEPSLRLPFDLFTTNFTTYTEELPIHLKTFKTECMNFFQKEFQFEGPISTSEFESNLVWLSKKFPKKTIILLTGAEVAITENDSAMLERHITMNKVLINAAEKCDNIMVCDVREFITDKSDLTDSIRHYQKNIYFSLAHKIKTTIKSTNGANLKVSKVLFVIRSIFNKLRYKLSKR